MRLINPTGALGIIVVFMNDDQGAPTEAVKKGYHLLPLWFLWNKGLSVGTGQTPVRKHSIMLREMMIARVAKPSFIVSHRPPLDKVPEAFIRGLMPGEMDTPR